MNKKFLGILFFLLISNYFAQETFRVMTYNVLNYPSKISTTRNPYFKKVIKEIDPDILVVQEMESAYGVQLFLNEVLDSNYIAGEFVDGYDTDNALFYKDSIFSFIDNQPIKTSLRNISQLTLLHKNSNDTLIIYSAHLKASDGVDNEIQRSEEVKKLREVTDKLPLGKYYLLVGDLNLYYSNEPAFQGLINKSQSGYFIDPLNKIGSWHNSSTYRDIHTQSTRLSNLSDEGSTGGLDDRFDMILASQAVIDSGGISYIPKTYKSFGNDGNHFNKAINELPNSYVSDEIAVALYYSSDHLPVFADFEVKNLTSIKNPTKIPEDITLYQNYPNPFNATTIIEYSVSSEKIDHNPNISIKIYNVLGKEIETLVNKTHSSGNYKVQFNAENLATGIYFCVLKLNNKIFIKKMTLLK